MTAVKRRPKPGPTPRRPDGLPEWWSELERDAERTPVSKQQGHGHGQHISVKSGKAENRVGEYKRRRKERFTI